MVTMIRESPPWMLGGGREALWDLTSRSWRCRNDICGRATRSGGGGDTSRSWRCRSDICGRAARSGGGGDLSFGESEFLCKRNLK
jgi:hypothetical protein